MEQYGKAKIFAATKRVTRKNDHGQSYSTSVVVPNRFEVGGIFGMAHRRFHSVPAAKAAVDEQVQFNALVGRS